MLHLSKPPRSPAQHAQTTLGSSNPSLWWRTAMLFSLSFALLVGNAFADTITRVQSYTYDDKGRIATETQDAGNPDLCRISTYTYDGYGNIASTTVQACSGASAMALSSANTPRTVSQSYTAYAGLYPNSSTNAVGHTTTKKYELQFGEVIEQTDPNGLVTMYSYDGFGRKTKQTDPDGTYTTWRYAYQFFDFPLSVPLAWVNPNAPNAYNAPAWYITETEYSKAGVQMAPSKTVYYNRNGKEIRTVRQGDKALLQSANITQDTYYDALGRVIHQTGWYDDVTTTATDSAWISTAYDERDRVIEQKRRDPDVFGGIAYVKQSYQGLTVTLTNERQTKRFIKSPQNQDLKVSHLKEDGTYVDIDYTYNANNNLVKTVAAGVTTEIGYDAAGNKRWMKDPSMGYWQYRYNVHGEMVGQTDGLSNVTDIRYDALGRMTGRDEPDLKSTWAYDSCKKGQLCTTTSGNDYTRTHTYDGLSRPDKVATKLGTETFEVTLGYDANTARLSSKTYPATGLTGSVGVKEIYGYSALGNFASAALQMGNQPSKTVWTADVLDNDGRLRFYSLGNGVKGRNVYANSQVPSGRLYSQVIGKNIYCDAKTTNGCGEVVNRDYGWNQLGNLTSRTDRSQGLGVAKLDEVFDYDNRDRLIAYQMAGGAVGSLTITQVQYDDKGNITYKSDTGSYTYDATRPYRLTAVNLNTPAGGISLSGTKAHQLQYDDALAGAQSVNGNLMGNGNLRCSIITDDKGNKVARWQGYSSYNLPILIEQKSVDSSFICPADGALPQGATTRLAFVYGPEHQRLKQSVSGGLQAGETVYLNGTDSLDLTFERTVKANGVTEYKHYLNLPDGSGKSGTLAQLTLRSGTLAKNPTGQQGAEEISYLHQDHIGSVMAVTDANGTVVERMAYDPWGNRRNTNGVPDPNDQLGTTTGSLYRVDRGFTLHEMLDEVGLIHMNGRVYEPALGRFMSADPMVTYPSRATSFNRYAYAMDNPLRFIDPTGWDPGDHPGEQAGSYPGAVKTSDKGGDASGKNNSGSSSTSTAQPPTEKSLVKKAINQYAESVTAPTDLPHPDDFDWSDPRHQQLAGLAMMQGIVNAKQPRMKPRKGESDSVPNPYGKLGSPEHQAEVQREYDRMLKQYPDKIVSKEVKINTPEGDKRYRFADVGVTDPKTNQLVGAVQVGKKNKNGTPVSREEKAMKDIEKATKVKPGFSSYN
jgi:RHS repeat-associated protein